MKPRSIMQAVLLLAVIAPLYAGCSHLKAPSRAETAEVSQRNHEEYAEGQEHEAAYEFLYWILMWLSLL